MDNNGNMLRQTITSHKSGKPVGLFCVCSSHPAVLEASIKFAHQFEGPLLIESTCNQVNQFGGYTGMVPSQFSQFVFGIADRAGLPRERVIFGGDHLGPNPWKGEAAHLAMQKAGQLVHDCVVAGYTKIHLDTSMECADDGFPLEEELSATRAAELCMIAEETSGKLGRAGTNIYVIGTEVPAPGGEQRSEELVHVTDVRDVEGTIEITQEAFHRAGIDGVWDRVIAIVVQPGVDFGDRVIYAYDRKQARDLSQFIEGDDQLVYEAHSTDYQTEKALSEMVEDHFALLKVGPELTFAYREGVFGLAEMERVLLGNGEDIKLSNLETVVDEAMLEKPEHWIGYYHGEEDQVAFARKYSISDRIRYYWADRRVQAALDVLFSNLSAIEIPLDLVSQYLPEQYRKIQDGQLTREPVAWVEDRIASVLSKYASACRYWM